MKRDEYHLGSLGFLNPCPGPDYWTQPPSPASLRQNLIVFLIPWDYPLAPLVPQSQEPTSVGTWTLSLYTTSLPRVSTKFDYCRGGFDWQTAILVASVH